MTKTTTTPTATTATTATTNSIARPHNSESLSCPNGSRDDFNSARTSASRQHASKIPERHRASRMLPTVAKLCVSTESMLENRALAGVSEAARLRLLSRCSAARAVEPKASPKSRSVAPGFLLQTAFHSAWSFITVLAKSSPRTSCGVIWRSPSLEPSLTKTFTKLFRATRCAGLGIALTGLMLGVEFRPRSSTSMWEMLTQAAAKRYSELGLEGPASFIIRPISSGNSSAK
mmetsp:Transcript_85274/g.153571  ORF Transcript_85274/g.153571 Transcript_85274/m.153571 type:complete len:232 (-) Transcript_85274:517-1212(-)